MKRKTILFCVIALFLLIGGAGCEKNFYGVYTVKDFASKPCVELEESAKFVQEFNNVQGVITEYEHKVVSFGGSRYCIKAPTKMFNSSTNPADSISIFSACTHFTEKDLGKKIRFSGKLFFTGGDVGNTNMVAYIYVFTNK